MSTETQGSERGRPGFRRRGATAETTYRETEYIEWLSKNRIPVVIRLLGDEEARGWIEYYDRDIIRLTRSGPDESSLFIFKERVKYLYEDRSRLRHDAGSSPRQRSRKATGERGHAR